jgi:hypothetical protein
MIVGLLAMLFMLVAAYITLARFDRLTTRQFEEGELVDEVVKATDSLVVSMISEGALDPRGDAYATIPGGPGSEWLASPEPVVDPAFWQYTQQPGPGAYRYPAVTSLTEGTPNPTPIALTDLMRKHATGFTGKTLIYPGRTSGQVGEDTQGNAREPWMDADGDGISDSYFGGGSPGSAGQHSAVELANAASGRAVRSTGFQSNLLYEDLSDPNWAAWLQFNDAARYIPAVRVISHGGMVLLGESADPNQDAWQQQFSRSMLNWLKDPDFGEGGDWPLDRNTTSNLNAALRDVTSNRAAVEPFLRLRGSMLTGRGAEDDAQPTALRYLIQQFGYERTLTPYYESGQKRNTWQRFNIGNPDTGDEEWLAWRQGSTIDVTEYLEFIGGSGDDPRRPYISSRQITTVNYSDELARDVLATHRSPTRVNGITDPNNPKPVIGIDPGQPKFYLGKIAEAFTDESYIVFDRTRGPQVIHELASYFHEMISRHGGLNGLVGGTSAARTTRRQAYMLAVNAVAAAARRSEFGRTDVISVVDPATNLMYVGYSPQPFITQVMAYMEPPESAEDSPDIGLAIELYNPHEPYPGEWGNLTQSDYRDALYLDQFRITVNDGDPLIDTEYVKLSEVPGVQSSRMNGRTFMTLALDDGVSIFNSSVDASFSDMNVDIDDQNSDHFIAVNLWRTGDTGEPVMVDRFEVEVKNEPVYDEENPESDWFRDSYRNMSGMDPNAPDGLSYLGGPLDTNYQARWRMVINSHAQSGIFRSSSGTEFLARVASLGNAAPVSAERAPAVPLYTMNAGLSDQVIHGAARPASYPTVGFLLTLPRFCHTRDSFDTTGWTTMGEYLRRQWANKDNFDAGGAYPADFGHMPIFDNRLTANIVGKIPDSMKLPWGLYIWDYFTTINPDEVDFRRVPGRINVNVAPWHVLAGLPVIGLPQMSAIGSPAFWSSESGILFGTGQDGTPRFHQNVLVPGASGNVGNWYRLGPYLALAAAEYRDRIKYHDGTGSSNLYPNLDGRDVRNVPGSSSYRPNGPYSDDIRGATNPSIRGFDTLGELANIYGFDSSMPGNTTVLGDGDPLGYHGGDFVRAVSLLMLLDTHFLTTRSNTFTVYTSVIDREEPQSSVRSQVTVDRSNLLPQFIREDTDNDGVFDILTTIEGRGAPETIGRRQVSYFNARYDD